MNAITTTGVNIKSGLLLKKNFIPSSDLVTVTKYVQIAGLLNQLIMN